MDLARLPSPPRRTSLHGLTVATDGLVYDFGNGWALEVERFAGAVWASWSYRGDPVCGADIAKC